VVDVALLVVVVVGPACPLAVPGLQSTVSMTATTATPRAAHLMLALSTSTDSPRPL
jgi:hypothetical protein